jgi:hypothetical protein
MDCSEIADADDFDEFYERLRDPLSFIECETCLPEELLGEAALDSDDPAGVAEFFKKHVSPENLPLLVKIVAELATTGAGTEKGEFRAAVLAALES